MRAALLSMALLGLGCAQHGGRLLVVVRSDLAVPGELSEIRVRVARVGREPSEIRTWQLGSEEEGLEPVPLSFAVRAPSDGSDVDITIEGYAPGCSPPSCTTPLVTRRALTGFVANTTRLLDVFLTRRCTGGAAPACDPVTQTCNDGACVAVRIDPETLPVLTIEESELDASSRMDASLDGGVPEGDVALPDVPGLDAPVGDGGPIDGGMDAPLDGATLPSMWTIHATGAAANDVFGSAVALDFAGGRAVIAAPTDSTPSGTRSGSVRVLDWSSTSVTEIRELLPPGGMTDVAFGSAVAIGGSGDACRVVVGAPRTLVSLGAAYVFECSSWSLESALERGMSIRAFGWSVAISRDGAVAVVGAPRDASGLGAAYAFIRAGTEWGSGVQLGPTAQMDDRTGHAVAVDAAGTRALVGAPQRDLSLDSNIGRAFVVDRASPTVAVVLEMGGAPEVQLGSSVAISGDGTRAVVGQRDEAIVFEWDGTMWARARTSVGLGATGRVSVAMDDAGTRLLVGEPDADRVSAYQRGPDGTWEPLGTAWAGPAGTRFGLSVAISGDGSRGLVGAPLDDARGTDAGAAYAFTLPPR